MSNLRLQRESRIFDFCISHAHQIIAELETSAGDHGEDVELLEGLIDTWKHLKEIEREMALNDAVRKEKA